MIETLSAWTAAAAFVASSLYLLAALRQGGRLPFGVGWGLLVTGGAAALLYMMTATVRVGGFPILNPWMSASFLSFLLTLFAAGVWLRYREPAFLAGAAPTAALFAFLAAIRPVRVSDLEAFAAQLATLRPDVPDIGTVILHSVWFPAHVTLALSAYALFTLAATMGLLQLTLVRALKRKRAHTMKFLPPLPVVETVGVKSVAIGMVALAAALIIGAVGTQTVLDSHWLGDPKEISGLIILLLYGAIAVARSVFGWTGKRVAMAHVTAFFLLVAVVVGSSVWAPKLHGF